MNSRPIKTRLATVAPPLPTMRPFGQLHVVHVPRLRGSTSGAQSFRICRSSLNRNGFVKKRSTPLEKASCWLAAEPKPVKAMIMAGFCRRSLSSFLIARVASIPPMTGMEMSASQLACQLGGYKVEIGLFTHEYNVVMFLPILKRLQRHQTVFRGVILVLVLLYEATKKLYQVSLILG